MTNIDFYILSLVIFCSYNFNKDNVEQQKGSIKIEVGYGDVQDFGMIGLPQEKDKYIGECKDQFRNRITIV